MFISKYSKAMENPHQDHGEFIPDDDIRASHNPNPDKEIRENWDEKSHMSRNLGKNISVNERRNLNPDREKRTGSNLNPDRNSGDR